MAETMTLIQKLSKIQQEVKAPKNRHNDYSNFDYRNAEDILNAAKPYEAKYNVAFLIQDEIVVIGDRFYVRATATIMDADSSEQISTIAYAREPSEKRGMDASQITGTASSYARKYALNGLLLLDDVKDPDSNEYVEQTTGQKKKETKPKADTKQEPTTLPEAMIKTLEECIPKHKGTIRSVCSYYGVKRLCDLTVEQFKDCMNRMGEDS